MMADLVQCCHPHWLGEDLFSKGDSDLFEEVWSRAHAEVITGQTKRQEVIFWDVGKECISRSVAQPECDEC